MFININYANNLNYCSTPIHYSVQNSIQTFFGQDLLTRIKNIARIIFDKVVEFQRAIERKSQANMKTIAMSCCILLIALLIISVARPKSNSSLTRSSTFRSISSLFNSSRVPKRTTSDVSTILLRQASLAGRRDQRSEMEKE